MPLDFKRASKPIRDLRRSLKILPRNPSVKAVHTLRTSSRKLEAIVIALAPEGKRRAKRLLKTIKPLRKSAGSVRDMDVLAAKAQRLYAGTDRDSVDRLLEHLHSMRIAGAHALLDEMDAQRNRIRRRLDRISDQLKHESRDPRRYAHELNKLIDQLMNWPALGPENLHDFRIKVKELRYVFQLVPNSGSDFVKALDAVKSRIGDWHDWQELGAIAHEVLTRQKDRRMLETIAEIEQDKFKRAFKAAQNLRTRYLGGQRSWAHTEP